MGSNATVQAGLEKLVADTGADEVIVVTDTYEAADRLESYQRVAEVDCDDHDAVTTTKKSPLSMFIHRTSLSA